MLDQKVLLSKYIYKCIVDPKIKAYKPNEILVLIKDMEI